MLLVQHKTENDLTCIKMSSKAVELLSLPTVLSSKNFAENNSVGSSQTLTDEVGIGVHHPLEWTMSLPLFFFVILLIT